MRPNVLGSRLTGVTLTAVLGAGLVLAQAPAPAPAKAEKKAAAAKADKAQAEKAAREKAAADKALQEKHLREVADARAAVLKAEGDKSAAERTLEQKAKAQTAATSSAAAAKMAADKATAEATAAKAKLAKATAEAKAAKQAVPQTVADKAAVVVAAADRAEAARVEAQRVRQEKAAAAKAATDKACAAQAAVDKPAVEKKEAEQLVARSEAAIRCGLARLAEAKATAYGGLPPLPAAAWDDAKARHLLFRAGFGGTPDEVAQVHALGLHRAVARLVRFADVPPSDLAFVAQLPERPEPDERFLSQDDRFKVSGRRQRKEAEQVQALRVWWLRRMAESPRPLEEKLTLFWHGHFACEYETVFRSHFMYQQNQMFRTNAVGNFGALLQGLVHDATMLRYLNNDTNFKGHPNENLAREIMELFAMGLGNYTEEDIREAAKALTGYSYENWSGQYRFVQGRHEEGPKTIFGKTGPYTGDDLVELILQQPCTARFIAKKLFTFFAYENPDPAVVERLAAVLRAHKYELTPMLENLFASEEFYSPKALGTQIKGPVQLLVGTIRELGIRDANYARLTQAAARMGQNLLQPPNVKGWDGGRTWIDANRVLQRYNALTTELLETPRPGGRRGLDLVGTVLACKSFRNADEVVDYLAKCCLARPLSAAKRQALIEFAGNLPPSPEWAKRRDEVNARLTALLAALLSSPEYQLT